MHRNRRLAAIVGIILVFTSIFSLNMAGSVTTDQPKSAIEGSSGKLAGDFYYTLDWYNQSFPGWVFGDEYQDWQFFWLNNGTEDAWVMVVMDINQTTIETGKSNYLSFNIYDDPDGSFLDDWKDNWNGFEDVNWDSSDAESGYVGSEISLVNSTEQNNSTENESIWDNWVENSTAEGKVEPSELNDYSMENTLSGDEGFWFLDISFEDWTTEFSGSANYTWYNIQFDEENFVVIGDQLDPYQLGPASTTQYYADDFEFSDCEWQWEWAQTMIENQSYTHETYSWIWFSYDIGQWVSKYDNTTNKYSFASTDTAYIGMSIYEDLNDNGVVDVSYDSNQFSSSDISILGDSNMNSEKTEYNSSKSELKYYLNFESVGDVEWGEPVITSTDAEFWICLENVDLLAIPYGMSYNWAYIDNNSQDLSIPCHLDFLNVSFSYQGDESHSSIAVKHDIPILTQPNTEIPIKEFENYSLTVDYNVYSDQYSDDLDQVWYDNSSDVPGLDDSDMIWMEGASELGSNPVKENSTEDDQAQVALDINGSTLANMDFLMNYTWGGDGETYTNTLAIMPLYGYTMGYGDMSVGVASTFGGYQSSAYYYSMCFDKWGAESITMDPTFVSLYIFKDGPGGVSNLFWVIGPVGVVLIGAIFGLVAIEQKRKKKMETLFE